jgi:hypothetical protein
MREPAPDFKPDVAPLRENAMASTPAEEQSMRRGRSRRSPAVAKTAVGVSGERRSLPAPLN